MIYRDMSRNFKIQRRMKKELQKAMTITNRILLDSVSAKSRFSTKFSSLSFAEMKKMPQ